MYRAHARCLIGLWLGRDVEAYAVLHVLLIKNVSKRLKGASSNTCSFYDC